MPSSIGAQQDQVLLAARGVLSRAPTAPGRLHRLGQQAVRPLAALVGAEVVRLVEVDGSTLSSRDELGDLDGVGRLLLERLQLLGGEE